MAYKDLTPAQLERKREACRKASRAAYYRRKNDSDWLARTRAVTKQWYIDNPDYNKRYAEANREHIKARNKARQSRIRSEEPWLALYIGCRNRAGTANVQFTITVDDIKAIWSDTCPILGIPMETHIGKRAQPNSRSVDRINPALGYVPDNIAIISHRANLIKNDGTADEHRRIYEWLSARQCT